MRARRKNIYEIKRNVIACTPETHFFDRKTMKFFQQTLRDFRVRIADKEKHIYYVRAHSPLFGGHLTERWYFDGELHLSHEQAVQAYKGQHNA